MASLLNTNRTKPCHNVSDTCSRINHTYHSPDYRIIHDSLTENLYIASNMSVICDLFCKVSKTRNQSSTNNTNPVSLSTIPGPLVALKDSYRESLVTWAPSNDYQALPEEHLRADLRHNFYIDNYTSTPKELERPILQPNIKVCDIVRKRNGKAVIVALLWDAEDATNNDCWHWSLWKLPLLHKVTSSYSMLRSMAGQLCRLCMS